VSPVHARVLFIALPTAAVEVYTQYVAFDGTRLSRKLVNRIIGPIYTYRIVWSLLSRPYLSARHGFNIALTLCRPKQYIWAKY